MVTRTFERTVENFLLQRLEARVKYSMQKRQDRIKMWEQAEDKALAYLHEQDEDSIRRSQRELKGQTSYTTLQIPYTYATLMTAHTYMTSVFFSRSPVHQFAGRHGESEQQVSALEALVSYQVEVGYHLVPYYIWLYDAGKYGCGILGNYWAEEKVQYSSVDEMQVLGPDGQPVSSEKAKKIQQTFRSAGYTGTRIYNVSPFDFGHDPHYPMYRFQEGEYCYVRKTIGWNEIKKRQYAGWYTKDAVARLPARPPHTAQVQEGSSALLRPDRVYQHTLGAANDDLKHPTSIDIFEVYVDLIQSEWQVGDSTYPEKWVFTISSDYGVLLGAEPLGNAHGKFPFSVIETEIEGYGLYSRGLPEIIDPIQRTMDWLINSHFYNVRASLNNQFIIDPSKIVIDDAEDGGPGFIYRLRPEAYGTDITKFFFQVPVADVTRAHMSDLESMQTIGERITGINEQMFGGISKSRTTATEVRTSTGFGVNRLKTVTEYISAMGISPLASRIVLDSQQFYDQDKKFKIVGDLAQMAGPAFMQVDPSMLSGDFDFVPVDGTLPIDRMAMATLWQNIMGQMRNFPQLMMQFDIGKVFTHVAQLGGIRNINQFKVQVVPDAVLEQQMGIGNVVPIRPTATAPGMSFNSNVAQMPSAGGDLAGDNSERGAANEIGSNYNPGTSGSYP
jgi:hypothetical protein